MKRKHWAAAVMFLAAALASGMASAHGRGHWHGHGHGHGHGHARVGIHVGIPFSGPYYYPYGYYPRYYYPAAPVVVVPASPPVYIEQGQQLSSAQPSGYWYYCQNPQGYYPTVRECPGGWQQVAPQAPAPQ